MSDAVQDELERDRKDALEHRDVLLALRAILPTDNGRKVFKFLFRTLQVNELPARQLEGMDLHDTLGYLRSGRAVFKIAAEADNNVAAQLMAEIEKENYAELMATQATT